jgi:hypothetical protein
MTGFLLRLVLNHNQHPALQEASRPNTRVIDPMDGMCSPRRCPIILDKRPLYIDGRHYSVLGSTLAVRGADQRNAVLDSKNGVFRLILPRLDM